VVVFAAGEDYRGNKVSRGQTLAKGLVITAGTVVGGRIAYRVGKKIFHRFDDAKKHVDEVEQTAAVAASKGMLDEQPRDALGRFVSKIHPSQRIPGSTAVDDFAAKAVQNGFDVVGREVSVKTPFGQRRYDIVLRNRETGAVHAVEVKSTLNAFEKFDDEARQQFAADRWVNRWGADALGQYEGVRIEGSSKVLWELK
jgi:hypothetical protein